MIKSNKIYHKQAKQLQNGLKQRSEYYAYNYFSKGDREFLVIMIILLLISSRIELYYNNTNINLDYKFRDIRTLINDTKSIDIESAIDKVITDIKSEDIYNIVNITKKDVTDIENLYVDKLNDIIPVITKKTVNTKTILDTEIHRISELTKYNEAIKTGFTKKTWITVSDEKVRDSHRSLNNISISIDDKFKVGTGIAQYPLDPSLPAKELINCRCYIIYSK